MRCCGVIMLYKAIVCVGAFHAVVKCFEELDIENGTAPDERPAQVLKMCARPLFSIGQWIRAILKRSFCPSAWTVHGLVPLRKRESQSEPGNYRAINPPTQISKVVERYLSQCSCTYAYNSGCWQCSICMSQVPWRKTCYAILHSIFRRGFKRRTESKRISLGGAGGC